MLIEGMPLWVAGTNAWIVSANGPGSECVLIDAPPEPAAIVARLEEQRLKLVAMIATHGHIDHVGGVRGVLDGVEAPARAGHIPARDPVHNPARIPVHIHESDKHMLIDPIGASGMLGRMLRESGIDVRPPEVIDGLDDGQVVSGAGMQFTAMHTPGHTPGSTCLMLEVDGEAPILFSGDHLMAGSIGRTDLPGGSYETLMESMAERVLPLSDDVRVLPGHGPTSTIGRERATNPFLIELQQQLGTR